MRTSEIRDIGILNSHSLAWRLGRAISLARQQGRLFDIPQSIIGEFGGSQSAQVICRGKIISVEHSLTMTAHTTGKVLLQQLSADDVETGTDTGAGADRAESLPRVVVEFVNENLRVKTISADGSEKSLAIVPDLIFLLDMTTGEAIGTPEYR